MKKYCTRLSKKLVMLKVHDAGLDLRRVQCKQWNCPHCFEKLRYKWASHIRKGIKKALDASQNVWFVTFTARGDTRSPRASLASLKRYWRIFSEMLSQDARDNDTAFEYAYTYEQHEDGAFHIHALIISPQDPCRDFYATNKKRKKHERHQRQASRCLGMTGKVRFRDFCVKAGIGYEHKSKLVSADDDASAEKVSRYVTKYISKQLSTIDFPARTRRVCTSRGFGRITREAYSPDDGFHPSPPVTYNTVIALNWEQKELFDGDLARVVTLGDFSESIYYPQDPPESP